MEVILRHGGEAQADARRIRADLPIKPGDMIAFLSSLILFPPDDTASNLDPGDPSTPRISAEGPRQHQAHCIVQQPGEDRGSGIVVLDATSPELG